MVHNLKDKLLRRTMVQASAKSLAYFHAGPGCCADEFLQAVGCRYDLERFGIKLQGSPRHADVLICTGPVTRQARDRLVRVYEQMPDPKFVVVVGSCGLTGGVFEGSYAVLGGVDTVIPVNAYVPGCPPRP